MLDITIPEDELEHDRILLEQNLQLQHTDYSFRLSSADGDNYVDFGVRDTQDDIEDEVEYPRHNSGPSAHVEYIYDHRGRVDAYSNDEDTHSQLHAWSYRSGDDDDEGIYAYGGGTVSSSGHHASAVTLSAGLGGGRTRRRGEGTVADASGSGAEYDPDRPLDAMMAGVEKLSMFDCNSTDYHKSKLSGQNITFDPLVVDSTAELDRVLQSGYQQPPTLHPRDKSQSQRSVRVRSPPHSSSTSIDTDNDNANTTITSRPKLSDALRRVSFSPKRPRSPLGTQAQPSHVRIPSSPLARVTTNSNSADLTQRELDGTARARKLARHPLSSVHPHLHGHSSPKTYSQPQVLVQQPTPSLSKSARQRATESTRERDREARRARHYRPHKDEDRNREFDTDIVARPSSAPPASPSVPSTSRHVPNHRQATPLRKSSLKMPVVGTPRFPKVHLPDVTGLTNAVESPAKMPFGEGPYLGMSALRADETAVKEVEARLIKTLNTVQSRIEHLEEENGVSRRRVRELEYELEECKREVVRERTRLLEETAELSGVIQAVNLSRTMGNIRRTVKGKGKARDATTTAQRMVQQATMAVSAAEERYREAVEEKKALEALIASLRSHLTRLTSELSEHQALLMELRSQREQDAETLRNKLSEVDNLKHEVERLAGEVEVLRGVVEEGLRERRKVGNSREIKVDALLGHQDHGSSIDEGDINAIGPVHRPTVSDASNGEGDDSDEESQLDHNANTNDDDPWSIDGSSKANTTNNPNPNVNGTLGGDLRSGLIDRTIRIDRASLGSSAPQLAMSTMSNRSILTTRTNAARANISVGENRGLGDDDHLDATEVNDLIGDEDCSRIEAEIEERRSVRSFEVSQISISPRHLRTDQDHNNASPLASPSSRPRQNMVERMTVEDVASSDEEEHEKIRYTKSARQVPMTPSQVPPRTSAPTPYHAMAGAGVVPQRQAGHRLARQNTERGGAKDTHVYYARTPETPFPQIRGEHLEKLFFSAPEHDARTCTACVRRRCSRPANAHVLRGASNAEDELERCTGSGGEDDSLGQWLPSRYERFLRKGKQRERQRASSGDDDEGFAEGSPEDEHTQTNRGKKGKERAIDFEEVREMARQSSRMGLPPQTIVTRVIRELEDDFTHYKSIYVELADHYKEMNATSDVRRRNILAQHLKEVVDILEQKGDQIASLYETLSFKDKLVTESIIPTKSSSAGSWGRKALWSKKPLTSIATAPVAGTSSNSTGRGMK
ncbi:hypothetical protein AMATHDRAFT_1416 [Amanita thiersii Skay4041]|uniref:Cep57 centrosome microtubule-binding domain-containing protein n=1 Tax=Amanita thiersii Skay4041 TaxID=703135 RepID=A0A2A9NY39_9AGAR|nr:hypothetical protein AMATHDRAFT_1416 [Amanita thiersii Skay4041]